ncbi:MAG: hypothetical protein IJX70_02370 [Clostridia bacterium]|nr:hypothetical protein [Clostridia bacterium]
MAKKRELTKWYRMDSSGMIYPIIGTLSVQSNYRLSFRLDHPIDPTLLVQALERTYRRFPYYKVTIERGFFRPYLCENVRPVRVYPDNGLVLARTDFVKNGYHPIMVTYHECSVFITFFHGLGDGYSSCIFLRYLIHAYLALSCPDEQIPDPDELFPPLPGEEENAYETYYSKQSFWKGLKGTAGGNAAQIKGRFFVRDGLAVMRGRVPVAEVLRAARNLDCSLTELIAAVGLLAAMRTLAVATKKKPPKVFIPVDLRKLFPSNTMFNFVGTGKCIVPLTTPLEVADYVAIIKRQLREQNNREAFMPKLAFTSLMHTNPILRFSPLFLKIGMSKLARELTKSTKQTLIVSNVGRFNFAPSVSAHLLDLDLAMNVNRRTPLNIGLFSVEDELRIFISRHIVSNAVEREFFSILRSLGIDAVVSSNYREVNHAL